ncbi:MAG: fimbria major subunit, partial [Muribaculaceae bacterium]|nr:fimbria major subunit [Muribaculaceae bacterium]
TTSSWYKDNEGTEAWQNAAEVAKEINAYLPDKQSYCYNDGMVYYNIPIRHLRPGYVPGEKILTGMFGVVRNHWYQVTISAIKNLGHSVYRPDEHIIPPSDDTRYMIGSSVKILSWRLVKSTVEL